MKNIKLKSFINKLKQKSSSILFISIISTAIVILFISIFSYTQMITNFKTTFSSGQFLEANKILLTKQNLNPMKHLFLNSSLEKYFINPMVECIIWLVAYSLCMAFITYRNSKSEKNGKSKISN